MKSFFTAVSAFAMSAYAAPSFSECFITNYMSTLPMLLKGMQQDQTTDSQCYTQGVAVVGKIDGLTNAVTSLSDFSTTNLVAAFYTFSEFQVSATDAFSFCGSTNFAKNLSTRTSTASGALDLVTTIGMSYVAGAYTGSTNELYTSYVTATTTDNCDDFAKAVGGLITSSLSVNVPMEYYADQLAYDLNSELGISG